MSCNKENPCNAHFVDMLLKYAPLVLKIADSVICSAIIVGAYCISPGTLKASGIKKINSPGTDAELMTIPFTFNYQDLNKQSLSTLFCTFSYCLDLKPFQSHITLSLRYIIKKILAPIIWTGRG